MQVGSHLSRLGLTNNPDWDPALQSAIQVEVAASHLSHLGLKVIPPGIPGIPGGKMGSYLGLTTSFSLKLFAVERLIKISNF